MPDSDKIQVEIWSDVMCPFCYIGKRQFEAALQDFEDRDRIEVVWKSYQLDPTLKAEPGQSLYDYLARRKGMTVEQSRQMHDQVARTAAQVGLDYRFDKVVVNNSRAAHRLIQTAKANGKGDALEEALFRSYFTEGKDIGDRAILAELAVSVGLTAVQASEAFDDPAGEWKRRVEDEAAEAHALGSTGVPFYVFQRQYAVTGAQGKDAFRRVLEKVSRENPSA
jgi:protein disulfide-isomerase